MSKNKDIFSQICWYFFQVGYFWGKLHILTKCSEIKRMGKNDFQKFVRLTKNHTEIEPKKNLTVLSNNRTKCSRHFWHKRNKRNLSCNLFDVIRVPSKLHFLQNQINIYNKTSKNLQQNYRKKYFNFIKMFHLCTTQYFPKSI